MASEIAILDVGHGNCALIMDPGAVTMIDAPHGDATHLRELRARGIMKVDVVLVSHADADHCGGVITLLLAMDMTVGQVFLNPDAAQRSGTWDELMVALRDANLRCGTELQTSLTSSTPGIGVKHTEVAIEVLGPEPTLVAKGPGSTHKGRTITSNSSSAMVRVSYDGRPIVLFAGDADRVAVDDVQGRGSDCAATYLVFPHHGGLPGGGDAAAFAKELCQLVRPQVVLFSIGRGRAGSPRTEIVDAVRTTLSGVYIACTQLASACAVALPRSDATHLSPCQARGVRDRVVCAGSFLIRLQPGNSELLPNEADHSAFVDRVAEQAICRRTLSDTPGID